MLKVEEGNNRNIITTKQWGDAANDGRSVLRLVFLLYYIYSLSISLCFLDNFRPFAIPLPGLTVVNYFIVDLFYWIDGFFIIKNFKRKKMKHQRVSISPIEAQFICDDESILTDADTGITVETNRYRHRVDYVLEVILQIIMSFPFEVIAYAAGNRYYRYFQLSRLVRVLYFSRYWSSFGELLEHHEIVKSHAWRRVLLVGLFMAISAHVGACLFYRVSLDDLRRGKDDTWLSSYDTVVRDPSNDELVFVEKVGSRYIISLYWAVQTLDTVGFGDITPLTIRETWFCTFFFYLSAALMYTSLAILVLLISNMDSARARYLIKVSRFNKYAAQTKLSSEMVRRVKSFYDYQWKILGGVDEHQILSELPSNLAQQVSQQIVRDRLTAAVYLFRNLRNGVLNALCENLESLIYSPQDVVVARRSRVLGVYVISVGEIFMVRTSPVNTESTNASTAPDSKNLITNGSITGALANSTIGEETNEDNERMRKNIEGNRRKRHAPRMSVLGVESVLTENQDSQNIEDASDRGRINDPSKSVNSRISGGSFTKSGTMALIRKSFTGGLVGQEHIIRSNQAYGISALNKSFDAQHELTAHSFVEVFYVSGTVFRHTCRMHMNRDEITALFKSNNNSGKLDEINTDEDGPLGMHALSANKGNSESSSNQPIWVNAGSGSNLSSGMKNAVGAGRGGSDGYQLVKAETSDNCKPDQISFDGRTSNVNERKECAEGLQSCTTENPRRKENLSIMNRIRTQLEPDSTTRITWKAILFFLLVYYTVSVPLLIAGTVRIENFSGPYFQLLVVSYVCDFLFLADLFLRSAVFSFKHDGVLYTEMSHIIQYFLASEPLSIEFLSNFPIDLLLGLFVSWELLPIVRLLKMLHLRWFQQYLTCVEDLIGHFGGISLSFEFVRFVTLYCCLFLLCHWVACFWLLGADISVKHFGAETNWKFWDQNTFTNFDPLTQTDDINVALFDNNLWDGFIPYVRALYFAGSAMSLGLGDVVPRNNVERIFACLIMFFGYVLFNTILGGIASLIGGFNREKREFNNEVDKMQHLLQFTNIPNDLSSKIMLYYDYLWWRYGGVNEMEVLASLPKSLRSAVVNRRLGPLISHIPFFSNISESMQQMLVSLLQRRVFLDKDCIIRYGETGKELFVIEKGIVIVTSADRKVVYTTLHDGDYMGESCLLEVSKRMSSAFAQGYVDTFYLTTNDFLKAAEIYPDEYDEVLAKIEKILDEKKRKNIVVAVAAEGMRGRSCSQQLNPQTAVAIKSGSVGGLSYTSVAQNAARSRSLEANEQPETVVSPDKGLVRNQKLAEKRGAKGVKFLFDVEEGDSKSSGTNGGTVDGNIVTDMQNIEEPPILETALTVGAETTLKTDDVHAFQTERGVESNTLMLEDVCDDENSSENRISVGEIDDGTNSAAAVTAKNIEVDTMPVSSTSEGGSLESPKFDAQRRPSYSVVPMVEKVVDNDPERGSSGDRLVTILSSLGSPFFTQHPEGHFKMAVDATMALAVIYYLMIIPLRITVHIPVYWLIADYFCDAINWFDCYLNWTYFAVYSQGYLVEDSESIKKRYCHQRAFVDVIVSIPWDLLALCLIGQFDTETILFALAVLRLPKSLKVITAAPYYKQLERLAHILGISFVIMRLMELTVALVVISHWVACVFYMMAEYRNGEATKCATDDLLFEYIGTIIPCKYIDTWVMNQITAQKLPSDGGNQWSRLVRAFNWASASLSLLTMGDLLVTNPGEALYLFLIEVVGLAINGTIIGYILTLVADGSEEITHVYRRIELLRHYLHERHVPKHLIDASVARLQHLATEEGSLSMQQDAMFASLPHSFKTQIEGHLKVTPFLRRCPFFDFCTEEVLRGIGGRLRLRIYTRGDKIVTFGELGRNMYFLDKGTVDVVSGTGNVLYATLEDGAFFGETALFFKVPRTATVLAASSLCVCFVLRKDDLENELRLCDYDEEEVLESFRYLQITNSRRNEAVLKNLYVAETDKNSKLHKLIQPYSLSSKYQASRLLKLRQALRPESWARAIWDVMGFFVLLYYIFTIPYWIAFLFGTNLSEYVYFGLPVDLTADAYWIIDIVLKAYLFSFHPDPLSDKLIIDGEEIWNRYLKVGYFYRDIVSSLPLELLFFAIPRQPIETLLFVRTIHFFRVLYLFLPQADLVEFHLRSKLGLSLTRSFSQLVKSVLLYIFLNHWMACVYFTIHRYADRTSKLTYLVADGLATYDPKTGKHDICNVLVSECYARSFYYVITTQATIGYGDVSPFTDKEVLWQIVVGMIGAFITATCIGFLGIYFQDVDSSGLAAFERNKASVERYLEYRQLSPQLQSSILAHYTHLWNTEKFISGGERTNFLLAVGSKHSGGSIDAGRGIGSTARNTQDYGSRNPLRNNMVPEGHILDLLSEPSVREISMILHEEIIDKVPILRESNEHIRCRMAVALRPQIGLVGCHIYNAGDTGNSIFFVQNGKVKVTLSADRSVLDSFGMESLPISLHKQMKHAPGRAGLEYVAGCHFGEFCVVSKSGLRAEAAQVVERTHLYALNKDYLWEILLYTMPKIRRQFLQQLMCNLNSEQLVKSDLFIPMDQDSSYVFAPDDLRVRYLFRMAYRIMKDIGQDLASQQRQSRRERRQLSKGIKIGDQANHKDNIINKSGFDKELKKSIDDRPHDCNPSELGEELEDMEETDQLKNETSNEKAVSLCLDHVSGNAEDSSDDEDEEIDPDDVHYDVRVLLREEAQRRRRNGGESKMLMSLQEQLYHLEDFENLNTNSRSFGREHSDFHGSMHRFSPRFSPTLRSPKHMTLQNRLRRHHFSRLSSTNSEFHDGDTPHSSDGNNVTSGASRNRAGGNIGESALDQLLFTTPTSRMSERGRQAFFNFTDDDQSPGIRRASSLENLSSSTKNGSSKKGGRSNHHAAKGNVAGEQGGRRPDWSPLRRANSMELSPMVKKK